MGSSPRKRPSGMEEHLPPWCQRSHASVLLFQGSRGDGDGRIFKPNRQWHGLQEKNQKSSEFITQGFTPDTHNAGFTPNASIAQGLRSSGMAAGAENRGV